MEDEIWKSIPEYEGHYDISNYGRLRSYDKIVRGRAGSIRHIKGIIRKPSFADPGPYLQTSLSKDGVIRTHRIHRLVAMAFLDDWNPDLEVNHIDGGKSNNRVANLEMCTKTENTNHARRIGLIDDYGEKHIHAKITNEEAHQIRLLYFWWEINQYKLADSFGISQQSVSEIVNNKKYIR